MAVVGIFLLVIGAAGLLRFGIPLVFSVAGDFSFRFINKSEQVEVRQANNRVFLKEYAIKTGIAVGVLIVGWLLVQ